MLADAKEALYTYHQSILSLNSSSLYDIGILACGVCNRG